MNILFIHEVDWLNKVVFDIHSLAESLSLLGHSVYAIDYEQSWSRKGIFDLGSPKTRQLDGVCRAFPGASVHLRRPGFIKVPGLSRLSAGPAHYLEIQRTIRDCHIDAIMLYGVATNGLQTLHLARKFNVPVVFRSIDILNQLVPYPVLRPLTRFLERQVYSQADMILTLTPKLSDYVIEKGAEKSRVRLLPMPVDTGIFQPQADSGELRQHWGITGDDQVVLFIGTLFDFSGLDTLIPRFAGVTDEVPQAKLLIVGDGPQRPKLENIITELGLQKHVTITGFQPYETMPRYINMSTLCINTFLTTDATRDIFPGKIVQYLACGKAVIATSLPGMIAMIPGEEQGVLYVDDADEMVTGIVSLLKSARHKQELERHGLDYVTRIHGYDRIARKLESNLEDAVKEKHHGKLPQRV